MKPAVQRVAEALAAAGVDTEPVEFEQTTRTAQDAADAIGVEVGQIVKSLVFVVDGQPVLALVSGANQASTRKLADELGGKVTRADAELVREATGYAIGGVPPIGHARQLATLIDEDLLRYATVYAAAGTPNSIFPIAPEELVRITGGRVVDLKQ